MEVWPLWRVTAGRVGRGGGAVGLGRSYSGRGDGRGSGEILLRPLPWAEMARGGGSAVAGGDGRQWWWWRC